jgi:hypothetical protein
LADPAALVVAVMGGLYLTRESLERGGMIGLWIGKPSWCNPDFGIHFQPHWDEYLYDPDSGMRGERTALLLAKWSAQDWKGSDVVLAPKTCVPITIQVVTQAEYVT